MIDAADLLAWMRWIFWMVLAIGVGVGWLIVRKR